VIDTYVVSGQTNWEYGKGDWLL